MLAVPLPVQVDLAEPAVLVLWDRPILQAVPVEQAALAQLRLVEVEVEVDRPEEIHLLHSLVFQEIIM